MLVEKILNSALNYAKQGVKVFPLKNTSNTDITLNSYQNMATTDTTKITEWFTNTDYQVGVSIGDDLIVIVVESKRHS